MNYPRPAISPWEITRIEPCIRLLPARQTYVEIGSRYGGSLATFGHMMEPGALLVAIDLPGGAWGRKDSATSLQNVLTALIHEGFDAQLVIGSSQWKKTIRALHTILQERQIDLLFIDGDHRLHGVAADVAAYAPLVKPGGAVMFHDCGAGHGFAQDKRPIRAIKTQLDVNGAFRSLAHGRRSIIIQEDSGLGLVYM